MKFQSLVANIGGVVKGVMITSEIIGRYLSQSLYIQYFSNLIFEMEDIKTSKLNDEKSFSKIPIVNDKNKFPADLKYNPYINDNNSNNTNKASQLTKLNEKRGSSKGLQLSFRDLIFRYACKSEKMKRLDSLEKIIDKILSVDHIVKKNMEVEKMKMCLFEKEEINAMKLISRPNFACVMALLGNEKLGLDTEIQKMWKNNLFENENKKEDLKNLYKFFEKNEDKHYNDVQKRILNYAL